MNESKVNDIWQSISKNRNLWIGIVLSFIMFFLGLLSLFWTPFSVEVINIPHKLEGPSSKHWLGTDHFGRDVFSMLMVGALNSMVVSLFAITLGSAIGIPLGILSASKGGWLEEILMRWF